MNQNKDTVIRRQPQARALFLFDQQLGKEFVRKSIHMLIALIPPIADSTGRSFSLSLLAIGTLVYTFSEYMRTQGYSVLLISRITVLASREDNRRVFNRGPITLGLGAMAALFLYPAPVAGIAIYALAFGDGFSSLVGKIIGTHLIPFTGGKTVEGSLACFFSVFIAGYSLFNCVEEAFIIAAAATLLEAVPLKDMDNIVLPIGTGLVAEYILLL